MLALRVAPIKQMRTLEGVSVLLVLEEAQILLQVLRVLS